MPSTVRVGVHEYRLVRKSRKQLGGDLGRCDSNILELAIANRLKKTVAQETLFHEVIHACHYPSFIGKENITEEGITEAEAPVLLQVLRDNPPLVEYLLS